MTKTLPNKLAEVRDIKSAKKRKMTITLSAEVAEHLDWLAEQQGITQVAAIRKAIVLDHYIQNVLSKRANARLVIEDENTIRELVIR